MSSFSLNFRCFHHPLFRLMKHVIRISRMTYLLERAPEDVYQEADFFLSQPKWAERDDLSEAETGEFCRAWRKKVYQLAKDWGLNPETPGFRREISVTSIAMGSGRDDINVPEVEDIIFSTNKDIEIVEHSCRTRWVDTQLQLCREAIIATGNGQAETEWEAFKGYLFGKNLVELQELTGWTPASSVNDRLTDCITRIRQKTGVSQELPLPPLPLFQSGAQANRRSIGKVSPRERERIYFDASQSIEEIMEKWGVARSTARLAKKRGWLCQPRKRTKKKLVVSDHCRVSIDTSLSIQEIMEKHEVSKATAHRAKKRGWVTKGYHVMNPEVAKKMRKLGCSRETASRLVKKEK